MWFHYPRDYLKIWLTNVIIFLYLIKCFIHLSDITCNQHIEEEVLIESLNYPKYYGPGIDCTWWITAPQDLIVQLDFTDVDMFTRTDDVKIYQYKLSFFNKRAQALTVICCQSYCQYRLLEYPKHIVIKRI